MTTLTGDTLVAAAERAAARMHELRDELTRLDAAVGDGDLGITASKGATAVRAYVSDTDPGDDLGKFLVGMGMAFNRAAPGTMGTLIATALMRAGKEARGQSVLDAPMLARMLEAADVGIQERGKAKPGDKTVIDALHPAAEAFSAAIERGEDLDTAGDAMVQAAREGRDAIVPLRSQVGRASWVGERTENQPDPGAVLCVEILEAIVET
jgi:phosphoenolpyruvate---glycerone phosphotransferase subunit DhaL